MIDTQNLLDIIQKTRIKAVRLYQKETNPKVRSKLQAQLKENEKTTLYLYLSMALQGSTEPDEWTDGETPEPLPN